MLLRIGRLRFAGGLAELSGFALVARFEAGESGRVSFLEESPEKVLQMFSRTTFAKVMLGKGQREIG